MKRLIASLAALAIVTFASSADARPRQVRAPVCDNIDIMNPCPQMAAPEVSAREARRIVRGQRLEARSPLVSARGDVSVGSYIAGATILPHPAGCPRRAFCGCGASVERFGRSIRSLWLAANWLRFPAAEPGPGMAAARRGHVFIIKQVLGGNRVLAYDANSGGRQTRLHVRSLAGFKVVDPSGAV